jgi:hypothetical protein
MALAWSKRLYALSCAGRELPKQTMLCRNRTVLATNAGLSSAPEPLISLARSFTEGLNTTDVQQARTLLDELSK